MDILLNREVPAPVVVHYDPGWPKQVVPPGSSPVYSPMSWAEYLAGPPPPLTVEEQAARAKASKAAQKKARADARELERAAFVSAPYWEGELPPALFGKYGTAGLKKKDRASIHKKIKAASDKAVKKAIKRALKKAKDPAPKPAAKKSSRPRRKCRGKRTDEKRKYEKQC